MIMTRAKEWVEPKRIGGPTMTTLAAAKYLGVTKEWIHKLVAKGPEHGGLAGYIPIQDGIGWQRKTARGNLNRAVMFYVEDIKEWDKQHKRMGDQTGKEEIITYTSEQEQIVLSEAGKILSEGEKYVNRAELMRRLAWQPGTYNAETHWGISRTDPGYGQTNWNTRTYKIMKKILEDHEIQLAPMQAENRKKSRRKY